MPLPKHLKVGLISLALFVSAFAGIIALLVAYASWKQSRFDGQTDTRDLPERAARMAETYLDSRPRGALVVGLFQRGETWVGGFGATHPDGNSVFEIGSITKVFTGIALADAVNRDKVKLDDPLAKVLPAGVELSPGSAQAITLVQLATHTAGVPRLPDDFWDQATDKENPYAAYTTEELFAGLKSLTLKREPGAAYEYSNFGAAILGQALAAKERQPYANLLKRLILEPLAMADTALETTPAMKERLVEGFSPKGEATSAWSFDAFAPAGGLRSTANDMLKFIRAALKPGDDSLGRAMKLSLEVHHPGLNQKVGLGWHRLETLEDLTIWWHNGGTGGFASYLGIDPEHQTGVIVLANHGDALAGKYDVDKIGVNLLTLAANVSLK